MVWFRVDDGWHKHRKRIRVGLDLEGFAARGLWVDAGSWASDELTDGFIPDDVLDYLAPGIGETLAKRLERARLWVRRESGEESGWQFHEWDGHQPTKEEVEAALSKKVTGGRLGNHRRWHVDQGKFDERCPYCVKGGGRSSDRTSDRYTDRSTEAEAIPPTRPDPSRPEEDLPPVDLFGTAAPAKNETKQKPAKAAPKTATRIPDDFSVSESMKSWAAENAKLVDWPAETERFVDYWRARAKDDTKKDWVAAWRTWLRNAQKDLEGRGITRRWQPGTDNQGRAGPELGRRPGGVPNQHKPFKNPESISAYHGEL